MTDEALGYQWLIDPAGHRWRVVGWSAVVAFLEDADGLELGVGRSLLNTGLVGRVARSRVRRGGARMSVARQPGEVCPHRNWWAVAGVARCTDCGATWTHPKDDPPDGPLAPVIPITRGPRGHGDEAS